MSSSFLYVVMRSARIKVDQTDTWYHCYNRVAGTSLDRPFRDADKEQFVRILKRVCLLYGVRVVAYQVMSNHYHLLVHAPEGMLSPEEVCRRYRVFHRGRKVIEPDTPLCRQWQQRARDISWFMRHLQQLFTMWYNRSRPLRRRGSLWADRFKHTILEGGAAVWACWKYIENNPVRAGMVEQVGEYRFCSYGAWRQCGVHPFEDNVIALVLPMMGLCRMDDLRNMMASALDVRGPLFRAGRMECEISCHMRHWVDGLVIGSELFVRGIMAAHHARATTRRISHHSAQDSPLACWRRLRMSAQASSRH
jgi:REP element-mobilizing transposase RayT